jgi:WD40 repeat protein
MRTERQRFAPNAGRLFDAALSPNGRLLYVAAEDGTVRVRDAEEGQERAAFRGGAWPTCLARVGNGPPPAAGGEDGGIDLWKPPQPESVLRDRHSGPVKCLASSPDGRQPVSGGIDRTVRIWVVGSGGGARTLTGHADWVRAAAFLPDGRHVVTSGDDETLRLCSLETGEELFRDAIDAASVLARAVSPRDSLIFGGRDDGMLQVWTLAPQAGAHGWTG